MHFHPTGRQRQVFRWVVHLLGLAAALWALAMAPRLTVALGSMVLFGGLHLFGALILRSGFRRLHTRRLRVPAAADASGRLDFGWARAWTLGPLVLAGVLVAAASALDFLRPGWWPAALVLVLLAANAFAGHLIARAAGRPDQGPLPMVDLLPSGSGLILDGGCGAGRTTVALARALPSATVVALDRFDAGYIADGGRTLLERNLAIAGVRARVQIASGDLTQLPCPDARYDAAVSAHAIDHLGPHKAAGLREIRRVLKPGAHFLLVVWVPGWTMFAVANLLSFRLSSRAVWRELASGSGFEPLQEGEFNGCWFLLLRRPSAAGAA